MALIATSLDAQIFGPPGVLSNTIPASDFGDDYEQQLSTDGAGNWVAVWRSNDTLSATTGTDWDIFVARSSDDGSSWSLPAALNTDAGTDSGDDYYPQISTDGAGNWIAVWSVFHSAYMSGVLVVTDIDILVARSTDNGVSWSPPAILSSDAASESGYDRNPQISNDGFGNWIAVWDSSDNLGDTIGTDTDILVVRSTDDGENWSNPAPLNSDAGSDSAFDLNPQLSNDGAGNWVAVWYSSESPGSTAGSEADILVSRSADDGANWSAPATVSTHTRAEHGSAYRPQVKTDSAGNWIAVWESTDSLGASVDTDEDILLSRSTDNGASWSAPTPLNTNAATDSGDDDTPHLSTDGSGNWIAVWSVAHFGLIFGVEVVVERDLFVSRSIDNGANWSAPAAINNDAAAADSGYNYQPRVSTNGSGTWIATWRANLSLDNTIGTDADILVSHSTDNGANWTTPVAFNANAAADFGEDYSPNIATDGAGNWVTVWESNDTLGGIGEDNDIMVARSTDNGASWSAPATLNTNAAADSGEDNDPQLTTDGAGNWIVVWQSTDSLGATIGTDADVLVARSTDNGASWSAPTALNANAAVDSVGDVDPRLSTDRAGTWIAVWVSGDSLGGTIGSDGDILLSRSTDNGVSWSAPSALNTNAAIDTGNDYAVRINNDGNGNWIAAWSSAENLGGTIGLDSDILFARSSDNATTWSAPAVLNSNAATDSGEDFNQQVSTDGVGNWIVVWKSRDSLGGTIGTDEDILTARSTDNGANWSAPAALNGYAASDTLDDHFPQVIPGGAGNWIAVWYTQHNVGGSIGTDGDILIARSADNGASWSAPGPLTPDAESDSQRDQQPHVTTDGAGNWVAVWFSENRLNGMASFGVADIFFATASVSCPDAPLACRVAQRSVLVARDKSDDNKDVLVWKWLRGEETSQAALADPLLNAHYTFCVYAGATPVLVAQATVLPNGVKWSPISDRGYKYKDKSGSAAGLQRLVLKAGTSGQSKVLLKGKGADLPDMTLPIDLPVTAQLVNGETGVCFEAVYDTLEVRRNEAGKFKAKAP